MQEEIQPSAEAILAVALTAPVHPVTGADIDALAPLLALVGHTPTAIQIVGAMPQALTVLAQILTLDRAALASLPMHHLLAIFEATVPRWVDANTGYFADVLAPAVNRITTSLQTVFEAVSATTPPAQ